MSEVEGEQFELPLGRTIDAELASDLEKQSVYVSEDLLSLHVIDGRSKVRIVHKKNSSAVSVKEKATRFLDAMLLRFRRIEQTVHYRRESAAGAAPVKDVFQGLVERQWAFQHSAGVVSLSGPALRLLDGIDDAFATEYSRRFSAITGSYPALIKASLLARCGYFEMHPNALSFVSHLVNDFDEIEAFRQANTSSTELQTTHPGAFAPIHQCLNPAACFPCYEHLENRRIEPEGRVLTWKGRVFRYESRNTVGLDRLGEFNVRELVFIGTDAFVKKGRSDAMALAAELMERWDLTGRIETATDPFFATVYAAKTFWQEAMDVKYEVCLNIEASEEGTARTIAAGSLNLHGAFFGDRFNIRDHLGEPAYTGCVGWGLERWVLAMFCRHGFDLKTWPTELRTIIS